MTTYLGKSCSFCLPRVPFVNCHQFMYLVISHLVLRAGYGIWLYQFLIITYLFTLPMCNGLDAIPSGSVSTGTGFRSVAKPDLHSAMLVVKRSNKRSWDCYVLERDRFGRGSFVVWGGKMGDQKTCKTISMHYIDDILWPFLHYFYT